MSGVNYIKGQAREHPRFRQLCIAGAQRIHRVDMRLRLGLLQDHASIDKQIAREAAEAQAKKQKQEFPTVKTQAQSKADEATLAAEKAKGVEKAKAASKPRIRPLSEAKAIDAGANFTSEAFLLSVGIGLIVFERWWSSRKESTRREDVAERIAELEESEKSGRRALIELEKEILRLRVKAGEGKDRILPKDLWEPEEREDEALKPKAKGLLSWLGRHTRSKSPLTTHDIALPIQSPNTTTSFQQQQLFLLLTPVSILGSERHAVLPRIERFATLTTDPKPAIAFLLANNSTPNPTINGFHTYMTLQTMLHELSLSLALLPVASPSQILPLLNTYTAAPAPSHRAPTVPTSLTLLRQITAAAPVSPLSEHSANVLSDVCHSIRDVAAMTESDDGMKVLEDYLGEEDAKNIESFWAEEWICE
ncbi:MAG: hypothetical protein Q9188_006345 [Gyalolechia gomerana]